MPIAAEMKSPVWFFTDQVGFLLIFLRRRFFTTSRHDVRLLL
jgi:hypothetical protein